ncbi:RHS repeat-associated core domain-containing protein [Micromonospora taraxaci]|uniref:RHS repeat-associated core domain-containing protein n=1 Tax=Micromonospora taraxaci TaxID=1316803 RepID=UPI0033CAEBCE
MGISEDLPGLGRQAIDRTSTVTGTRYYQGVGAVRTPSNKVNFLLGDHHGTAQQTIDATTQASTRRKFTPYGQARGTQPSVWPGQKGFVGGTIDSSTGLTHLGAREYDAATGRFISVDPIVDFTDPQQMQGYAYANNSPVSFSDASGLRFCADDNCSGNGGGVAGTGPPPTPTKTTTPSNGTKTPSGPSDEEVRKAKTVSEKKILDVVIEAGGQILLEVLGINDIRDCVTKGDIGACAMAVVGALPWGKILKAKKIGQAMLRAGKAVMTWFDEMKVARRVLAQADEAAALFAKQADEAAAAAAKQADDAAATAAKQGDDVAETATDCAKNSFTPDTRVVMGDGSTKPIEEVQLGEEVLASDPESGLTEARPVVGLIVGEGQKNLIDVTVDTDGTKGDASGSVIATDGHPFWVADLKEWVKATDLKPGQWLRTSAGTLVQVEAVRPFTQQRRVHNLTVDGIHTYHVLAGAATALVHNCGADAPGKKADKAEGYDLQAKAKKFREDNGIADNQNVAVYEYTSSSGRSRTITMANIPRGTPGHLGGLHSEIRINRELARRGVDPSDVTRIYSERIPCPVCLKSLNKYKKATIFWDPE